MKSTKLFGIACLSAFILGSSAIPTMAEDTTIGGSGAGSDDFVVCELDDATALLRTLDPSTYGGAYYDENQKLHIKVTNEDAVAQAYGRMRGSLDVVFETAQVSMEELTNARDEILSREDGNINAVGFDEEESALVVYMDEVSEEAKATIIASYPDLTITFKQGQVVYQDLSTDTNDEEENGQAPRAVGTIYAGKWLAKGKATTNRCTLTTSAITNFSQSQSKWKKGFLTVAHEFKVGNQAYYGGNYIGSCIFSQNSGRVDAAFIESSYMNNCGGLVSASQSITMRGRAIKGQTVTLIGAAGGKRDGTISETGLKDTTNTTAGVKHSGYFSFTQIPKFGDSGGPILVLLSDGNYKIVGYDFAGRISQEPGDDSLLCGLGIDMDCVETDLDIVPCRKL